MVNWSRSKEANEWCFLGHAFLDVQDAVRKPRSLPWQNRNPPKIGKKAFEKDDADADDDDGMMMGCSAYSRLQPQAMARAGAQPNRY